MKIVSTLVFCTLVAPGIAFGMDFGQERQKDQDRTTEQHLTQDHDRAQHRQMGRTDLDASADGLLNTLPQGAVSISNLIGSNVRSQVDNDDFGTIEDILIDRDGNAVALIVSVGGFLGIGDKDVALSWDSVQLSYEDDNGRFTDARTASDPTHAGTTGTTGQGQTQRSQQHARDLKPNDYVVVVTLTRDALENAPEFNRDWD